MNKYTYSTAILDAYNFLLKNYPEVFVIGQGLWSPWYVGNTMKDLDKKFGKDECNVVCTITDPYVVHHGALGGFVTIYLKNKAKIDDIINYIKTIKGVELVLNKKDSVKNTKKKNRKRIKTINNISNT